MAKPKVDVVPPAAPAAPATPAAPVAPAAPAEPAEPVLDNNKTALDEMLALTDGDEVKEPTPLIVEEPEPELAPEPTPTPATPVEPVETPLEKAIREGSELRALLNEMAAKGVGSAVASGSPAAPPVAVAVPGVPAAPAVPGSSPSAPLPLPFDTVAALREAIKTDKEFFTKEEIDQLIDNPALIQVALNKVRRDAIESVLGTLPQIAGNIVQQQFDAYRASQDFYEANEDLSPYREFVKTTYMTVQAQNKELPLEKILAETAAQARKSLRLPTPVKNVVRQPVAQPKFVGRKAAGSRTPADSQKTEKSEQDFMAGLLNN